DLQQGPDDPGDAVEQGALGADVLDHAPMLPRFPAAMENGPGGDLRARWKVRSWRARLLDLDLGAGFLELLLDLFGLLLGDVLDDVLRSAFDQVLGFLQAQVRTDAADFLDHVDLLVAAVQQDDGEFGLLFAGRSGVATV